MKYEMNLHDERMKGIQQGIAIGKEQGIADGLERGMERGIQQGIVQVIVGMLNAGATYQFIADATRYPIERIAEIDKNRKLM